ncbi:unnamed protein product, partial [Sphacelaria rigidula]
EPKRLQDLHVYTFVPKSNVPLGQNVIGPNWVFKVKPDETHKVSGRDCGGTFAPVCRLRSIGMMLAIATEMNAEMVQLDVNIVFLYVNIEGDVFIEMTPGFEIANKKGIQLVMKLERSLYRLAQSPRNSWKTINQKLIELKFMPLESHSCVYIYNIITWL